MGKLAPGVTIHGHDIGHWLDRQRQPTTWRGLSTRQRERLTELGVRSERPRSPVRMRGWRRHHHRSGPGSLWN
ncbi:helicase associated domain-containing protein [Yinghuangia aomiensis]|uniref:helicase associated domain-containing protein n=1 Tax=Yinghuangia aomiensis TaxID=676205 RepID=UPI003CD0B32C